MTPVWAIASNSIREAMRNRVFLSLTGFALAMVGCSFLLTEVQHSIYDRILVDAGLGAMSIFGALLAMLLGISQVNREIERRTVYNVVSKPIRRAHFVVGKYLGLCLVLTANLLAMLVVFLLVAKLWRVDLRLVYLTAFVGILVETYFLVAVATFFSTFCSTVTATFFTLSTYVIGHLSGDLKFFGSRTKSELVQTASAFLYRVLPNLEALNFKTQASYAEPVSAQELGLAVGYAAIYVVALMTAASTVFARRDFR
ncbi:MAG: ABC transporter permease [Myxococcota bacterium]